MQNPLPETGLEVVLVVVAVVVVVAVGPGGIVETSGGCVVTGGGGGESSKYSKYIYIYISLGNFGEKNLFLTRDDDTDEY